jgi:hypothetical protein
MSSPQRNPPTAAAFAAGVPPQRGMMRNPSLDSGEQYAQASHKAGGYVMQHPAGAAFASQPPGYGGAFPPATGRPSNPNQLRTVVTTSFSVDEEREDTRGAVSGLRPSGSHLYGREIFVRRTASAGEDRLPAYEVRAASSELREQPTMVPYSPNKGTSFDQGGLKRSFWHHARPEDAPQPGGSPAAFMPPKRNKPATLSPQKDATLMARVQPEQHLGGATRSQSWVDGRGAAPQQHPMQQAMSFPAAWGGSESARSAFRGVPHQQAPFPMTRNGSFQVGAYGDPYANSRIARSFSGPMGPPEAMYPPHFGVRMPEGFQLQGTAATTNTPPAGQSSSAVVTASQRRKKGGQPEFRQIEGPIQILAQPEDQMALSETLCTIRENVEIFVATQEDVDAPAPGRKHPVVVGQVGLRCVHCRNTVRSSDRVKRAVCYPSSIQRIYRTVIDMKLDHFQYCPFVPPALKQHLSDLKQVNARSTGTTMQYFVRSAEKIGLVNGPSGIRMGQPNPGAALETSVLPSYAGPKVVSQSPAASDSSVEQREPSLSGDEASNDSKISTSVEGVENVNMKEYMGQVKLSIKEDKASLSPLRCLLRENVAAFSATEADIAVRTPTTFSVVVGQVGIGCVHCLALPPKDRANRAVCFPFSVARIYQSVADLQRFHFHECKMVPPEVRQQFLELQAQSTKGSKGFATRQYWVSSAKKLGLVDTPKGMRFGRDPKLPVPAAFSLDILAQVASNVNPTDRQIVLPEDKDQIAEFLYVVMEQLKTCRSTEADRNKRRLKDVGCIGVECKHCAGTIDSRKFFWSSVSAVESNFVSVHTHMMECKMVPDSIKQRLAHLKTLRKSQTAKLKCGSQKTFFAKVWDRLQEGEPIKKEATMVKEQGTTMHPSVTSLDVSDDVLAVSV